MDLQELLPQLRRILAEYEEGDRAPRRAKEVIIALFNGVDESPGSLPLAVEQIRLAVNAWNQGDRSDVNVLATASVLTSQLQGAA